MMKRWRSMPSAFLLHFRKRNGHPIPESVLRSHALKSRRRAVDVLKWQPKKAPVQTCHHIDHMLRPVATITKHCYYRCLGKKVMFYLDYHFRSVISTFGYQQKPPKGLRKFTEPLTFFKILAKVSLWQPVSKIKKNFIIEKRCARPRSVK